MVNKEKGKSVKVNKIEKKSADSPNGEKRLLDNRLRKNITNNFSANMALTLLAFLVFSVAAFVYFFFYNQPETNIASNQPVNIVIPETDQEVNGETATTTPDETSDDTEQGARGEQEQVEILTVQITDTPTGWLNVRTGPGTNFEQIGRVNPGQIFELVSENEQETWYEIKLNDEGNTGWVIKTYAELQ